MSARKQASHVHTESFKSCVRPIEPSAVCFLRFSVLSWPCKGLPTIKTHFESPESRQWSHTARLLHSVPVHEGDGNGHLRCVVLHGGGAVCQEDKKEPAGDFSTTEIGL